MQRRRIDAFLRRRPRPGTPPGTVVADPLAPRPVIDVMAYGPDSVVERRLEEPEGVHAFLGASPVTWLNVDGLGDAAILERTGAIFGIHPLALEDVVNVHQRPKVELYGNQLFVVARMAQIREGTIETEQVNFFLTKNALVTFQERPGMDCLETVRQRIRGGRGKIRSTGPDYLLYTLLDTIVDSYFPALEHCGERLDVLEDEVFSGDPSTPSHLQNVRRELLLIRRITWPLRDAVSNLMRDPSSLISDEARVYLRDTYDHLVQIIDLLETYRELASGLLELYLTSGSQRLNEIMKVLTIISTIFIPLSFVAGVYGMNFDPDASPWNMPELRWLYGYPFALGIMAIMAACLLGFFWRRGWLTRRKPGGDGSA